MLKGGGEEIMTVSIEEHEFVSKIFKIYVPASKNWASPYKVPGKFPIRNVVSLTYWPSSVKNKV